MESCREVLKGPEVACKTCRLQDQNGTFRTDSRLQILAPFEWIQNTCYSTGEAPKKHERKHFTQCPQLFLQSLYWVAYSLLTYYLGLLMLTSVVAESGLRCINSHGDSSQCPRPDQRDQAKRQLIRGCLRVLRCSQEPLPDMPLYRTDHRAQTANLWAIGDSPDLCRLLASWHLFSALADFDT